MKGKRILILRPEGQIEELEQELRERGAIPVAVPAVEILDPASGEAIDEARAAWSAIDWAIFTSVNGVRFVAQRLDISFSGPKLAAVGPATKSALEAKGAAGVWTPSRFTTRCLAEELPGAPGSRVLAFRAAEAGTELEAVLQLRGMKVTRVDAYRTRPINQVAIKRESENSPDAVVFTSASIVRSFAAAAAGRSSNQAWAACSIGPATSEALEAAGIPVTIRARTQTIGGVLDALSEHFGKGD